MFIYIWYDSLPLFGCCRCFVSFSSEFPEKYYIFLGRWKPVGVSPYRAQAPNSPRNLYLPLEIPLLRTRFHSYLWIEREMGPRMAPNLSICYLVSVSPELGLLSPEPSGGARPQPSWLIMAPKSSYIDLHVSFSTLNHSAVLHPSQSTSTSQAPSRSGKATV